MSNENPKMIVYGSILLYDAIRSCRRRETSWYEEDKETERNNQKRRRSESLYAYKFVGCAITIDIDETRTWVWREAPKEIPFVDAKRCRTKFFIPRLIVWPWRERDYRCNFTMAVRTSRRKRRLKRIRGCYIGKATNERVRRYVRE